MLGAELNRKGMHMTNSERDELKRLYSAAELLLADVKRQREAIDRRERELTDLVAAYKAQIGEQPDMFNFRLDTFGENESRAATNGEAPGYGAITETVLAVFREHGRRMNVPEAAKALELRGVPKTAKSYDAMARTAIRRLHARKKLRKVALGYYSLDKSLAEAH